HALVLAGATRLADGAGDRGLVWRAVAGEPRVRRGRHRSLLPAPRTDHRRPGCPTDDAAARIVALVPVPVHELHDAHALTRVRACCIARGREVAAEWLVVTRARGRLLRGSDQPRS